MKAQLPNETLELDATLTKAGYAADAKKTGEAIAARALAERMINGKALTEDVNLTADDVKARGETWMPSAADVGARPSDWMPSAADVGARPSNWTPSAAEVGALPISGGEVTGVVKLNGIKLTSGVDYGDTLPAAGTEGQIFFKKVSS